MVGAAAVTSLGWEAYRILKIDGIRSEPLWFAGYLFVYNFDRLYPDPSPFAGCYCHSWGVF
jgi:hypothetical protein